MNMVAGFGPEAVGDDQFFVSYSSVDGREVVLRLVDPLIAGPPPFSVWFDQRELQPGLDWDRQLVEAIRGCRAVLFVMTLDSVTDTSVCKREWIRAVKYKKPIIPLLFDPDAELPFQLEPRQYIDFTGSFDTAMAQLRQHLLWMDSPEGVLQALKERLEEAVRELPRAADATRRARIQQEIDELRRQLGEQQLLVENPQAASEQTEQRIASGLERERQPERPVAVRRAKFVNPPPMVAPSWWQDRHLETKLIGDFLKDDGLRLLTAVGRGGIGKTAMVCRLLKALQGGQLPDDLGPLAVDGIVYLSPSGGRPVSFPNLFADLGRLLPDEVAERLSQQYRDPEQSIQALMRAVLQAFPTGRTVVLLDNFEDVVDPQTFAVSDSALEEALQTVLTAPPHGVKVILTTRVAPQTLALVQPGLQRPLNLDKGLESPFAENILKEMDADETLGLKTAPDALLVAARERTRGIPRALEALVASLAADRNTSLPELLAETGALLPEKVVEVLVGEAFNRLDPLAQQVMQALAVYGWPVPPVAVDYLLQPYLVAIDSAPVLGRLVNMQFVRRDVGRYYLHQVDRDYALSRLPQGQPSDRDALERPLTRYALLARGAEFFEETRTPRESWKQLEDLAAQLAEFELRCAAGDYDTAATVLADIDYGYMQKWGHYRTVVELHGQVDGRISDPTLNAGHLTSLGLSHSSLGDYQRAIELYTQALTIYRDTDNRDGESAVLGNLGNCFTSLGDYQQAIELHTQSLAICRDTGSRDGESAALGNLGLCYSSLGDYQQAIELHTQALTIDRDTGNRDFEAADLGNLGSCHSSLGDYQQAIELHSQCLAICRDTGNRDYEAGTLGNLGSCYSSLGDYQRAIELYTQALTIAREIGGRDRESSALRNLGSCYSSLGDYQQAIELHTQALAICRDTGNRDYEAGTLSGLGLCYSSLGDYQRAIELYTQSLAIAQDTGNRDGESAALGNLGLCYSSLGDYQQAIELHTQSLAIAQDTGNRYLEAAALDYLGRVWLASGDTEQAQTLLGRAVALADSTGDIEPAVEARSDLARTLLQMGDQQSTLALADAALQRPYPTERPTLLLLKGIALLQLGRSADGGRVFEAASRAADALLELHDRNVAALQAKALVLCGLAVATSDPAMVQQAAAFTRAGAVTTAAGVTAASLQMLDQIRRNDQAGLLTDLRAAQAL
jgi:tetratricopeptide (TPR) repeat protein